MMEEAIYISIIPFFVKPASESPGQLESLWGGGRENADKTRTPSPLMRSVTLRLPQWTGAALLPL